MGVKAVWLPSSQSEDAKAASKRWQCACAASLARRPPAWLTSHGTGSGRQARPGTWARGHVGSLRRRTVEELCSSILGEFAIIWLLDPLVR